MRGFGSKSGALSSHLSTLQALNLVGGVGEGGGGLWVPLFQVQNRGASLTPVATIEDPRRGVAPVKQWNRLVESWVMVFDPFNYYQIQPTDLHPLHLLAGEPQYPHCTRTSCSQQPRALPHQPPTQRGM